MSEPNVQTEPVAEKFGGGSARRGVLTLAFGHQDFIENAKDLARSLIVNSPTVTRAIATDSHDPDLHVLFSHIQPLPESVRGIRGLEVKLFLDQMTPFDETLYLDSDTLVFADLEELWSRFQQTPFAPVGRSRTEINDWHRDSQRLRDEFGIKEFAGFNGGLYYFRKDPLASRVFETARELRTRYDELDFIRLGKGVNEEPLYSVAMSMHGLAPVSKDRGPIMSVARGRIEIDVLQGRRQLTFADGQVLSPHVLHFCPRRSRYAYQRERYRLRWARGRSRLSPGKEILSRALAARDFGRLGVETLWGRFRRAWSRVLEDKP